MTSVSVRDFARRLREGAQVFDTRPLEQYRRGALLGARHLSLEAVQAGELPALPLDEPIYLVCERGLMSDLVALYLEAAGFSEVYNVEGGMVAWRRAQLGEGESQTSTGASNLQEGAKPR